MWARLGSFLCTIVVVLLLAHAANGDASSTVVRSQPRPQLPADCTCLSARNDYYYRYNDVVRAKLDAVYHYQNLANDTQTWNCSLCANRVLSIYLNFTRCVECPEAIARYTEDFNVTTNQYADYLAHVNVTGRIWHCEYCVIPYTWTCIAARAAYTLTNPDIGDMDPVFHYITYGFLQFRPWSTTTCDTPIGLPAYPENTTNCVAAQIIYKAYHPDLWGYSPMDHYSRFYLTVGWSYTFWSCTPPPSPRSYVVNTTCECLAARLLYWANYPEVAAANLDPVFHYTLAAPATFSRFYVWNCSVCQSYPVYMWSPACSCPAAEQQYKRDYYLNPIYENATFSQWLNNYKIDGNTWHCEMCPNTLGSPLLSIVPSHMLLSTTCLAARDDYLIRYNLTANYYPDGVDAVWHFEKYGYNLRNFWDSGLCLQNPIYITDQRCQCGPAISAYKQVHPDASYYLNTFDHWRAFYLRVLNPSTSLYWPCEMCISASIWIGSTSTGILPVATSTSTTSTSTTSTTTTTSTTASAVTTASPLTTSSSTTDQKLEGGDGLSITAVLAIVVPVAAVLSVGLGMLFIHQQRRQTVQALIKAEEGERRNYKIDLMSLSIDWLVGSGSFGHVYRGEYRGADVAIKKLKKQNMGNQQLEDFAKEAMVMVGLRHPNIVLFMGVCLEPPDLCIVTEYMPRGSLYDVLHDPTIKLPFNVIRNMAMHVVKGLQFIHSAGMIHRDLKSPNLLVDSNWTIKIADFGLSCAKSQVTDDVQISLLWTAPEILMREKNCYSEKSDVYSLGIIFWEMVSRQTPFSEFAAAAIPPVIVLGKRPPIHSEWNGTMKAVMAHCWDQNAAHRPLVREVRVTLEGISQDSSYSDGGINTPASIYSSVSSGSSKSDLEQELGPFPPKGAVTLVFTDICGSTLLWEADPRMMNTALKIYNEVFRQAIHEFNGYEAKTEGDFFLVAFSEPVNALNFCVAIQFRLMQINWPEQLLAQPSAREEWNEQNVCLYRGLRVRMGVHIGDPDFEQDRLTNRMEYTGVVVNETAAVASHATGGQIILTADVHSRIMSAGVKVEGCVVESMGTCLVKGMHESIVLYQVWPKELKARSAQPVLDLTGAGSPTLSPSPSMASMEDKYVWDMRNHEKWIINYDDMQLGEVIGTGSFGDVYEGAWKGQPVAVKQFMKQKVTDEVLLEMRTESGILSQIEHPNIIKFLGMCIKMPHLCIVTELLERGSLSTLLLGNEPLSWIQRKNFALGIAKGLEYLHKNNIIHRDVKSPNMLVSLDWSIKIADFGFSRVKAENHTMTQCGTVAWTAPEIFLGDRYTEKADVYSYSVILWELVFRKKPWHGMNSMKVCHAVENGERLSIVNPPANTPEFIMKLMAACWRQEHDKRPSFTEVLKFLETQA